MDALIELLVLGFIGYFFYTNFIWPICYIISDLIKELIIPMIREKNEERKLRKEIKRLGGDWDDLY